MKKNLRITVKGQTYDVVAEILDDEQPAAPRTASVMSGSASAEPAPAAAPAPQPKPVVAAAAPGDIPSPIAGTVVSIAKPVGSEVAVGDVVMVLEAMKMNTEVTSPAAGKVASVAVTPGQTIEEGQVLMSLS